MLGTGLQEWGGARPVPMNSHVKAKLRHTKGIEAGLLGLCMFSNIFSICLHISKNM